MGKRSSAKVYEISNYNTSTKIKAKNANQELYLTYLNDFSKNYVFATGPAGTGKTLLAVEKGIEFFERKLFNKIIITRPAVSVDEEHGFLPGTLEEKMDPWVRPIMDVFKEHYNKEQIDFLIKCGKLEISPLAYMRGRTFKNAWIVADEMQNATVNQMKLLLTRLGDRSRIVITGDLQQNDQKNLNGLQDFLQKEKRCESSYISTIAFKPSDVERHPAIKDILQIYGDE
jgi:phosphate starvation-inducible PhoH-like protein